MGVKRKQVSAERHNYPIRRVFTSLFLAVCIALWHCPPAPGQPPVTIENNRGTIAIDAGHGGQDIGSRGDGGTAEKDIGLAVARRLTHLLEPDYRVVLTRSDDYDIALWERAAIANHHRADLFISIHTAASFLRSTQGMRLYYYQPAAGGKSGNSPGNPAWEQIQTAHAAASQSLALAMQTALARLPGQTTIPVRQGPLAVLQGADMPAVAIEVGHLTHPSTEELLKSAQHQTAIAEAIAEGADRYLRTASRRP